MISTGAHANAGVRRPRRWPSAVFPSLFLALLLVLVPAMTTVPPGASPARAAPPDLTPGDLTVTLTALEDANGAGPCRASLTIESRAAVTLATFSLRLVLFDSDGAVLRQLSVLAMPVRPTQPTEAVFPASARPCADLGGIRLRDMPLCADADGRRLSCDAAVRVRSLVTLPLER